jgi:hypothetical protein
MPHDSKHRIRALSGSNALDWTYRASMGSRGVRIADDT